MCGLFGVVLPHRYPADIPVGFAVGYLGVCAEERGRDAAGVAVLGRDGTWQLARTLGRFRTLHVRHPGLRNTVDAACVVLGHTRWATQGGLGLAQASPIEAGALLGTHNGDINPATIPRHTGWVLDDAATDSHHLFTAIAAAHRHRLTEQLIAILSAMHGRAALVWTDTSRTDHQLWVARAGLSPLAVGVDQHGGLWWASNPAWLREMAERVGLQITVTLLPEGTLWTVLPPPCPRQLHPGRRIQAHHPSPRHRHARTAVWRGFEHSDTTVDQTLLRHRTVA